jgi:hypothetical protein
MLSRPIPTLAAVLALAVATSPPARSQETVDFLAREEMIEAIADYAASGGCKTRRDVFGPAFDATCRKPDTDGAERIRMLDRLDTLSEAALVDLCRRNRIADCEKPREVSKGRAVLAFESAFAIEFNSPHATWSPDGRLLLLDNLDPPAGEVRILDVAAGRLLDPPIYAGPQLRDAAWSPDGRYIALGERRRAGPEPNGPPGAIRLVATATRKEAASIAAADTGCEAGLAEGMAFSPDAKALWVPCRDDPGHVAKAVRLSVPGLQVEESFVPAFATPGWTESYWEEAILPLKGDLVASVRFRNPKLALSAGVAVQSFSLHTGQPLHPPVHAFPARLAADLSGLYVGSDLWSTATGERVATGAKASGRLLADTNRLPQLGMHIEAKPRPGSRHGTLIVVDSASGATVQELGPVPTVIKILAAPDGTKVAAMGFHEIRVYRVSPGGAAAPAGQGR